MRRALWLCVGVAVANALAWAIITPTFQVPDETPHAAYVSHLVETGDLPAPAQFYVPSPEFGTAMGRIPWSTKGDPRWLPGAERAADEALSRPLVRVDGRGDSYVAGNPPLYYLLSAPVYAAARDADVYDRIFLMRLLSVLLAGVLAACAFGFAYEVFGPRPLWPAIASLAVSLHPMVGFLAGGVSPDTLLSVEGAAILWLLARAFRRGITTRLALSIGAVMLAALLTKPGALTLVPGLLVGGVLALWATPAALRARALRSAGAGAALLAAGWLGYRWIDTNVLDRGIGAASGFTNTDTRLRPTSMREFTSYLWQYWLPRLPSMTEQFGTFPTWPAHEVFFKGFVGRFGWFEYGFPKVVNDVALVVVTAFAGLAGRAAWLARAALRPRWREFVAYAAMLGGLIVLVQFAGYRFRNDTGAAFEQTRYLFPVLLPLYGAFVAAAVRGLPRRWAVPGAAFVVTLLAGHDLAAQLLTLQRYYL